MYNKLNKLKLENLVKFSLEDDKFQIFSSSTVGKKSYIYLHQFFSNNNKNYFYEKLHVELNDKITINHIRSKSLNTIAKNFKTTEEEYLEYKTINELHEKATSIIDENLTDEDMKKL